MSAYRKNKYLVALLFICMSFLLAACSSQEDHWHKETDTKELVRQWNETLENERVEPSGKWTPFSPEVNIDSLMKAWYGDKAVVRE